MTIDYTVIKSKRKTLTLSFDEKGNLIVKSPLYVTKRQIERVISEKQNWILSTKEKLNNSLKKYPPLSFKEGDFLLVGGEKYVLTFTEASVKGVYLIKEENKIIVSKNVNDVKNTVKNFYKNLAKKTITERLSSWCLQLGENYKSVSFNFAKTRWGSCGSGTLNFNVALICCPDFVIEYVVIHELCHLKIKNHKKEFWQKVEKYCPYYKTAEKYLKENKAIINLFN
ncbi:MAG TPA: hypothetical protein DDW16_01420 [Clostridiales bacterium]|nr:hypothetical protein [Clostridiales bacterium]